jgi:hypothetical protein
VKQGGASRVNAGPALGRLLTAEQLRVDAEGGQQRCHVLQGSRDAEVDLAGQGEQRLPRLSLQPSP